MNTTSAIEYTAEFAASRSICELIEAVRGANFSLRRATGADAAAILNAKNNATAELKARGLSPA